MVPVSELVGPRTSTIAVPCAHRKTLAGKGVELPQECRMLPCRISVYEDGRQTCIGMVKPTALLASLSDSHELKRVAEDVELALTRMIDAAK